jgi:hypothetical protein
MMPSVVQRCALLPVIKDFHARLAMRLANLGNASMHGVGTKLGTVDPVRTLIALRPLVTNGDC